jgi:hypothetical protein
MTLSDLAGSRLIGLWKFMRLDFVEWPFLFNRTMVLTSAVDESVTGHLY